MDLTKKEEQKGKLTTNDGKIRFGQGSALHQRMQNSLNQNAQQSVSVAQLPNRIGLMLDVSGSMAGQKIEMAKAAGAGFVDQCDPNDTAVAVNTFDVTDVRIALSNQFPFTSMEIQRLHTHGGTPMIEAMQDMLHNEPITRGVLVSDGEPTSGDPTDEGGVAYSFKEAGIPVDCVHIGDSDSGEECLKSIAKITGGLYIKFTNIENFSKNFKYLTPRYRALLNDSRSAAKLLGASEVI
jgi:Mg-chelatase subunit ChlD